MTSDDYEHMGAFYLGRPVDAETGETLEAPLLYDSKDLTTHAVLLGMTGSGKTGLAISLLEEALIDGVPVIAIDPKGDLGNLMLTFPDLAPADFRPWIDEAAAARAGETPDAFAAKQAEAWRSGLAEWGQSPDRIARFEAAGERVLFTPGSRAGTPLSMLRALDAPPAELLEDEEAFRERVEASVAGLLGLLGVVADPLQSRESILLSTLVDRAWRDGQSLDLVSLIQQIQKPPVERVGVMEIETFFPAADRMGLAMRLNNLLASPSYAAWMEGQPMDVSALLRTADGRPRLSIVSIAHLGEAERMFVVTRLLSEIVSWMRTRSGSPSLRALVYMDEVFGYFPPTENPPCKRPMLTLLKQARAYGVGCVLATQNPVDLDYKGLSNCGTWFLGRLQTERDKARVIDGLETVASGVAGRMDRATLDRTLSGLAPRTFVVNNVHEDEPVLMRSRWALSYLAGPLSRAQIKQLGEAQPDPTPAPVAAAVAAAAATSVPDGESPSARAVLPAAANESVLPIAGTIAAGERVVYRPVLLARVSSHYANARAGVDEWTKVVLAAPLSEDLDGAPWEGADRLAAWPTLDETPRADAAFGAVPAAAEREKTWARWAAQAKTAVYRDHPLELLKSKKPKAISAIGESEGAFLGRLAELRREAREVELEKLRKRYAPKLARMQEKLDRALERVDREEEQWKDRRTQTVVSGLATVVGALFGRKLASVGNIRRAASTAKNVSRTQREHGDIARAEARVEEYQQELADLDAEFREALAEAEDRAADFAPEVETLRVNTKKADLDVERLALVWVPFRKSNDGFPEPLAQLEKAE